MAWLFVWRCFTCWPAARMRRLKMLPSRPTTARHPKKESETEGRKATDFVTQGGVRLDRALVPLAQDGRTSPLSKLEFFDIDSPRQVVSLSNEGNLTVCALQQA